MSVEIVLEKRCVHGVDKSYTHGTSDGHLLVPLALRVPGNQGFLPSFMVARRQDQPLE